MRIVLGVAAGLLAVAALCALFFLYLLPQVIRPAVLYKQADMLYAAGRYEQAANAFADLGDYKDSRGRVEGCEYAIRDVAYGEADALFAAGRYEEAMAAFEALSGHRDSEQRAEGCRTALLDRAYDEAMALFEAERYEEAAAAFAALDGHRDSAQQIEACHLEPLYADAVALYEAGTYEEAIAAFEALGGYRDSVQKVEDAYAALTEGCFAAAQTALQAKDVPAATEALQKIDGAHLSLDQQIQLQKLYAGCGKVLEDKGDLAGAFRVYQASGMAVFERDMERCNTKYVTEPKQLFGKKKDLQGVYWTYSKGQIVFTIRYSTKKDTSCTFRIYGPQGADDRKAGTLRKNKTEFTFSIPYADLADGQGIRGFRLDLPRWSYSETIPKNTFSNADKDLYGNPLD